VISATADTEAWCAGAVETARAFLFTYRPWYHWFLSLPLGWMLLILFNAPMIYSWFLPKGEKLEALLLWAWLIAFSVLGFLWAFRAQLFPSSQLVVTEDETWIRRHSAEISLVMGVVSAILAIVGWFVKK
jgi:hypothetical protein